MTIFTNTGIMSEYKKCYVDKINCQYRLKMNRNKTKSSNYNVLKNIIKLDKDLEEVQESIFLAQVITWKRKNTMYNKIMENICLRRKRYNKCILLVMYKSEIWKLTKNKLKNCYIWIKCRYRYLGLNINRQSANAGDPIIGSRPHDHR